MMIMKYCVIFILLFFLIPVSEIYAQSESDYILNLNTENSKYISGQVPVIFGSVYDSNSTGLTTKIDLSIIFEKNKVDEIVYSASILAKDGKFRHVGFSPENTGTYTITASITDKEEASTNIKVEKFYLTKFGIGTIATIISIFLLLVVIKITPQKKPVTSSEPVRFALLTLCSLIPIITLIATDVQIGQDGVAGLVIQEISDSTFSLNLDKNISSISSDVVGMRHFNWVMHFGGNVYDNYQSGITVPIYILFFGMVGGYLRFLYKTQKGWFIERTMYELKREFPEKTDHQLRCDAGQLFVNAENKEEDNDPIVKRAIFNNSMQDLSLVFLPPILAVASYFLLLQGGLDEKNALPTFAVVSFAIGLISNEIVQKLANFATSTVSDSNNSNNAGANNAGANNAGANNAGANNAGANNAGGAPADLGR